MNPRKASFLIILNALFFAAAIILSSYLSAGTQYEQNTETITQLLIALWIIPNSILAARRTGQKCRK